MLKNVDVDHCIFYMADEPNKNRKYINPFMYSKEAYEYYKNMITDLEISLIKEQLKKNKFAFIPQTHNIY